MKMKQRISVGVILLALLIFCSLAYHQTVWASDMAAQTEVHLYVDENENSTASDSNDTGKAEKADGTGVQTGGSENILPWSLTAGTGLLACIAAILIRKKSTEASK